ncbi:flagellar biosynthesis protein FlgB [Aureimonas sp. Leaf454]|uniref:flagellar basal body rod protein FlgB n=1 Tax=Aureimonas sp. Leaf454 TaxID=1736381 RepID=UPI0006F8B329|nr:flagellar basal body rod protein FlgB [Aureimonas sp. Leaf454]KQT45189.1 flagellar biosynthesis protein FlgB [Aureimonas sp. Leaf454]
MDQVYLFGLASRRAEWLSNRQVVVSENIANVNTPGFRAKDIEDFSEAMETTRLAMAGSSPLHLSDVSGRAVAVDEVDEGTWGTVHSGNSVSLEQEMLKAGEISRDFALDTSVVKAFHRFLLTATKG